MCPIEEQVATNTSNEILAPALAAFLRALLFSIKKGAILSYVKKQAFLRLGALTSPGVETATTATYKNSAIVMTKNMILGMSVFGTYEYIAYHDWFTRPLVPPVRQREPHLMTQDHTPLLMAPIGAGLCSGVAQSIVMTGWEYVTTRNIYKHFGRRAIHHAIGYSSLFGSYECIRQSIQDRIVEPTMLKEYRIPGLRRDEPVAPLITSFLAGGVAGQVHHVVSYITTPWQTGHEWKQGGGGVASVGIRLPSWRSTMGAYLPTALAFVAFQYGGEMTERIMEEQKSHL